MAYLARHLGTRYTRAQHAEELDAQRRHEAGHAFAITRGRHAAYWVRSLPHPETLRPLETEA